MLLSELTAPARRVALVGLAKNTGKTEAMAALLRELAAAGRRVGVTSVGRDGEERDALDERIRKPRIRLAPDSLVATTDLLLRASGLAYEPLVATGLRTAVGRVTIARLPAGGAVEVAGPGTARDVGAVADAMLDLGAERVLVDGALDRRAGASPAFADGVVLCTGAAFERDPAALVRRTREAADLLRLPPLADGPLRELAAAHDADLLVSAAGEAIPIDPQLVLAGSAEQIAALLRARPDARHVVVRGALCEAFLEGARAGAGGRQLTVVVADATRVFLARRSVELYRARGVAIEVLAPIDLRAITVNPLAPPAHRLDGPALRARLGEAIPGVPVLDVLEAGYTAHPAHAALTAAGVAG